MMTFTEPSDKTNTSQNSTKNKTSLDVDNGESSHKPSSNIDDSADKNKTLMNTNKYPVSGAPAKPRAPTEPTPPAHPPQPPQPPQPSQPSQSSQPLQPLQSKQPTPATQPTQLTQLTQPTQPSQRTQAAQVQDITTRTSSDTKMSIEGMGKGNGDSTSKLPVPVSQHELKLKRKRDSEPTSDYPTEFTSAKSAATAHTVGNTTTNKNLTSTKSTANVSPSSREPGTGSSNRNDASRSNRKTHNLNPKGNLNNSNSPPPQPFISLGYHGEHRKAVSAVAFAPTSSYSPWATNNNQNAFNMEGQPTGIRKSNSYAICASASADGTVKVWDITSEMMNNLSLADSGKPTDSGSIHFSRQITPLSTLVGHSRGINDVAWSRTAEYLATASDDKTLRLWDATTGDALVKFKGHTNFVFALNFNPQSNLLCSGSFDETVKIWDIRSGDCVSTIPAHSDPVTAVDFNRDGTCIVSGSHDGLIRVWDTATGECLKTIYAEGNPPVSYVKFSPNGKFVLAGTLDSKLRLWQIASKSGTGNPVNSRAPSSNNPRQPSADGKMNAYPHSNTAKPQNINNYDTLSKTGLHNKSIGGGKCTKTYSGHVNSKYCTFSAFCVSNPSRESIISGSEDGQIFLYNLQSRQVQQVLKGHTDAVLAVAAHDKKEILASGGMTNDRSVRFWVPAPAYDKTAKSITQ